MFPGLRDDLIALIKTIFWHRLHPNAYTAGDLLQEALSRRFPGTDCEDRNRRQAGGPSKADPGDGWKLMAAGEECL